MPKIIKVGLSEYRAFYLCDDKKVYASVWGGSAPDGKGGGSYLQPYPPTGCIDLAGGQYHGLAIDGSGYPWTLPNDKIGGTKVNLDSCVTCYVFCFCFMVIRKDGTVWAWYANGNDYNFPGLNTTTPIQISPKGIVFTKMAAGGTLLGLTNDGSVYEWSKGNITPVKKSLPSPATDIFSSYQDIRGAIVNGAAYGWGNLSFVGMSLTTSTPRLLGLAFTNIVKIVATWNVIHFIDNNGDLWGMGDNAQGEIGNGYEKVNKADLVPNPYVWDWKILGGPMVFTPVKIASGIAEIYGGNGYVFYHYAIGKDGSIYSWGRTKSVVLGNGIAANNESDFPNAFDVLYPTKVDPFSAVGRGVNFVKYTINAGVDQTFTETTAKLSGIATASTNYKIVSLAWAQTAGLVAKMNDDGKGNLSLSNLSNGKYAFTFTMQDNNGGRISKTVNVTVQVANKPPQAAISPIADLTLPQNVAMLDGNGSFDPDGTIANYLWTQLSGPIATLKMPTAIQCPAADLTEGAYSFKLQITDNQGASTIASVSFVVKPKPIITQVDINYSDGRIITQS